MLGGRHQFEFVDKEPLIFRVVVFVLLANTFSMLLLEFAGEYFLPKKQPEIVHWYMEHSIAVKFILLALLALILLAFRKRVRYFRQ